MSDQPKVPKNFEDLGVEIGTKDQIFWTNLKEKLEADNVSYQRQAEINDHIITLLDTKIEQEKEKLK